MLAAAILVGIGSSHNMGEESPAFAATADVRKGPVQAEAWFTSADKIETQDGWASRLGADIWSGPIAIGAHWAHRQANFSPTKHSKDVLFARVSTEHGPLRLIGEVAPTSKNMEARAEARVRFKCHRFILEPRYWVGWHSAVERLGGYAWGVTMYAGVAW